jgi:hypothetical protein
MRKAFQLNGQYNDIEVIKILKLHYTTLSGPVTLKRNCDLYGFPSLEYNRDIFVFSEL